MREVLNISITPELKKYIEKATKEGDYSSSSEFMRDLVRQWKKKQEVISDIKESLLEKKKGNYKELISLKDLM